MTIRARFLSEVAAATSEAEVDAAVDQAIKAVASNATTAQIAAALASVPSAADRRGIARAFGIEIGTA
jgi:hypothetical protein